MQSISMTTSMIQQTRAQFCSDCQLLILEYIRITAHLKTACKSVRDIVLEQMPPLVVHTRPAPHVLTASLRFALVEDGSADRPHNDAEDEEGDCEDGVISGYFLCSPMTAS